MDLNTKIANILGKYDIKNGDDFICTRYSNPELILQYTYVNGAIRRRAGMQIGNKEAKNILTYYTIKKA